MKPLQLHSTSPLRALKLAIPFSVFKGGLAVKGPDGSFTGVKHALLVILLALAQPWLKNTPNGFIHNFTRLEPL